MYKARLAKMVARTCGRYISIYIYKCTCSSCAYSIHQWSNNRCTGAHLETRRPPPERRQKNETDEEREKKNKRNGKTTATTAEQ